MSENKTQILKYSNLLQYKNDQSLNLEVCLSELIDNSISSFQKNLDKLKNNKILEITLKSIAKKDGEKELEIIDNAFGMGKSELEEAIVLYKDTFNKDSTSMNQFGIGLKHSIFWIGDNATIYSNNQGKIHKLSFYPINKNERVQSTNFETNVNEVDNCKDINDTGTKIIIECHKNKKSNSWSQSSDDRNERICDFLGKKYKNYLLGHCNFQLKINFVFIDEKNSLFNFSKEVKPKSFNDNPLKLSNLIKNENNKKEIYCSLDRIFDEFKNEKNGDSEIINRLYEKFVNDEEMIWKDKITIKNNKNESIDVEASFSLLSDADKYKSGLIIGHNKRYIYFPPSQSKCECSTYEYCDEKFIDHHHKWVSFEINLEDISGNEKCEHIKPDQNKTRLIFDDDDDSVYNKNWFDQSIKAYIKSLWPFIKFIKKIKDDYNLTSKITDVVGKNNKNHDSVTSQTAKIDIERNELIIEDNYTIAVKFKNDEREDEIVIIDEIDDDNKKIKATLNLKSKFIKDDFKSSLPLLLLYIFLKNQNKNYILAENNINNILEKIEKWNNNEK